MTTDAKVIVITSVKNNVGKTTTSAALGAGLALRGHKTVVVDFDLEGRHLEHIMGCERRVIYDCAHVIRGDASLGQALIKDRRCDHLYILTASQKRDRPVLSRESIQKLISALKKDFSFVVCNAPAGLESATVAALYFSDETVIVSNPNLDAIREVTRMIEIISGNVHRESQKLSSATLYAFITKYSEKKGRREDVLSMAEISSIIGIPLLGVIPESKAVLTASAHGVPVPFGTYNEAQQAYANAVSRLLGEAVPFTTPLRWQQRIFGQLLKNFS